MQEAESSQPVVEGPFRPDADCDWDAFGAALKDAGYNLNSMRAVKEGLVSQTRLETAVLDWRTEEPTPFNTLFRLFILGYPVPPSEAATALGGLALEPLVAAGILRVEENVLRANALIGLWQDRFVFSDFAGRAAALAEHVVGAAEASSSLSNLTVRRPVESALDVGTGGGCQALLLSAHSANVVGTDVSPRALNFAAANARLNGVQNLRLCRGSFFEPVQGSEFDLIVSNPPFIISPESRFVFRDSGLPGDAVSRRVVEEAALHLKENGFATILINWHHKTSQDWAERPAQWVRQNGCDVFWLRCDTHDPVDYALMWMRNCKQADSEQAEQTFQQWLEYYEALGAKKISFGAVVMRKRSNAQNWSRFDFLDRNVALGPASGQILRIFEAEDFLANLVDDEALLDQRFRVASAHVVEQNHRLENHVWQSSPARLRLTEGIEYFAAIDEHVMKLLASLESGKTLREVASALATELHADTNKVVPLSLAISRALLQKGLLELRTELPP